MSTRALVTGGTGFVGCHLAAELLRRGHEVTVLDNLATGPIENVRELVGQPGFRVVVDDVTREEVLDPLVAQADVVVHLAAVVGVQRVVDDALQTIQTNVLGTDAVLRSAERHGPKVLLASTSEVYGKCLTLPAAEDDDVLLGPSRNSRWSYAASKLVDELLGLAYHRQRGVPVVVFRLFNTVGPRQTGRYGMVVPRFVSAALSGEPLTVYGDGQQSRSFLHVQDAVEAVLGLVDHPDAVGQVFNVGGSQEISILDLARTVVEQTRSRAARPAEIRLVPYDQAYGDGFEDIRRRVADTTKIRELLGWQPQRSLRQIIGDVADEMTARTASAR